MKNTEELAVTMEETCAFVYELAARQEIQPEGTEYTLL